jgi:hypothetical protein
MKSSISMRLAVSLIMALATIYLSAGTAHADSYTGRSYAEVAQKISDKGGKPVISTVVGTQLATDDCIVASWRKASYVKDDNFDHEENYLLSLNCSAKLAHAGQPGNSLATPAGREEKAIEEGAAKYNEKPARCAQNLETCQKFCDKYGLCSKEVTALF